MWCAPRDQFFFFYINYLTCLVCTIWEMGIFSRRSKYRWAVATVFVIMLGSFLFRFVCRSNDNKQLETWTGLSATTHSFTVEQNRKVSSKKELPICVGNLLDKRQFHYKKDTSGSFDINRLVSKIGPCRLRHYTVRNAVTCFDGIASHQNKLRQHSVDSIRSSPNKELRFAFMGDSRVRQQFLNFVRLIPDYDKQSIPNPIPFCHHDDIEFTSNILRMRVSFKWHAFVNDTLTEAIRQWTTSDSPERPHWILLSVAVWHMLQEHGANYRLYEKNLSELGPLLGQLANVSQLIWLQQYPLVELHGAVSNTEIVLQKINGYNKITRLILESLQSSIRIWDSSNLLAEEYIRDCTIFKRHEKPMVNDPDGPVDYAPAYFNCGDYLHVGYVALSQATQLLLNDICNSQVEYTV